MPTSLTIPTNRKVRLPYEFAQATCQFIQQEYETWVGTIAESKSDAGVMPSVHYSLQLREISEIRQEIICYDFAHHGMERDKQNVQKLEQQKVSFLTGSYARFHWQAEFKVNSEPALRIFFDATDIPQGKGISAILELNIANAQLLMMQLRQISKLAIDSLEVDNFCTALLRQLKEPEEDYPNYLTETFGGLRAPAYLKEQEVKGGEVAKNANSKKYYGVCHDTIEAELEHMLDKNDPKTHLIWAIAHDGCLLVGLDLEGVGHPSLTAFKPARIAGELWRTEEGWRINSSSGRYSRDYPNSQQLLANALEKFQMIFYRSRDQITSYVK
ncbi:hypothetical protein [Duganella sp. Root198D2]|uniref:hypothetical protein n=1 Tax=Duganella sp. Root198D2 TaxID=1736489 RepID=UPI000AFD9A73|nr:hypothetical protein [Duganella sp. Root198D2]